MKYLCSHKPHFVLEMFQFVEFLKVFSYCVDSDGKEETGGMDEKGEAEGR
jgi:hypothetical protein